MLELSVLDLFPIQTESTQLGFGESLKTKLKDSKGVQDKLFLSRFGTLLCNVPRKEVHGNEIIVICRYEPKVHNPVGIKNYVRFTYFLNYIH